MQTILKEVLFSDGKDYALELTSCDVDGEEQMRYTTYGIRLSDRDGNTLLQHRDISTDRAFVEEFVHLCVGHEVAAIHVDDMLEDYMD